MKMIDMHVHLNEKQPSVEAALKEIVSGMEKNNIEKSLLLQLNVQRFDRNEVGHELKKHKQIIGFANINPFEPNALKALEEAVTVGGYKGLKLHPRLEEYQPNHPKVLELFQHAGKLGLTAVVDYFPDGNSIRWKHEPWQFAELAAASPNTPLVIGHFGGFSVIEMMLLGKRVPNMYFNIAYSFLYFRGSRIPQDMVYAIQSLRGQRVFYGSDFPDRSFEDTIELTVKEFKKLGLSEEHQRMVMYDNAARFLADHNL